MLEGMKNLAIKEEGQALTEYGLIIALVSVLLAGSLILFKTEIAGVFTKIIAALKST
ncbi:Flp family type IVb pilin [Bacillus sp. FJAT-29814]|uniref:Flp family type IVb pilin n=1 Tax=Bacillus sp. FJAT-29814 TaxID=1729688 RepID=UPI000AF82793|nr:Flp family type IVb pilin [Bacillus sp. FJAT-29814]